MNTVFDKNPGEQFLNPFYLWLEMNFKTLTKERL